MTGSLIECAHSELSAECEGYEDPTEPLSVRIECLDCGKHLTLTVQDVSLLEWESD